MSVEDLLAGQPITAGNEPSETTEYFVEGKYVLVACAVSAVTAAFVTRKIDFAKHKKFVHKYQTGTYEKWLQAYDAFIYSEGLKDKFLEFFNDYTPKG